MRQCESLLYVLSLHIDSIDFYDPNKIWEGADYWCESLADIDGSPGDHRCPQYHYRSCRHSDSWIWQRRNTDHNQKLIFGCRMRVKLWGIYIHSFLWTGRSSRLRPKPLKNQITEVFPWDFLNFFISPELWYLNVRRFRIMAYEMVIYWVIIKGITH